jgi:hypothetical protein
MAIFFCAKMTRKTEPRFSACAGTTDGQDSPRNGRWIAADISHSDARPLSDGAWPAGAENGQILLDLLHNLYAVLSSIL